jgi:hypothetical protein
MICTIHNTGKRLIVTLEDGTTVTRSTDNYYRAAIVGTVNGKLNVLSAHWTADKAQETFATFLAGKFVNHKFTGATNVRLVLPAVWEPLDADAWKAADDAVVAKHKATA